MDGTDLARTDGVRPDLVPIRVPGSSDIIWVPPRLADQAEALVRQNLAGRQPSGGAGTVGTFADIAEGVADFFGQEQIQRQVDEAHRARRDVLDSRKDFRDTLSAGAQREAFMNWQNNQDELDQAQTAALETSVTLLRVSALAAAGRGLGRVFNTNGSYIQMAGGGTNWAAALAAGIAGFGLAEIFLNNNDRGSRGRNNKVDPWK